MAPAVGQGRGIRPDGLGRGDGLGAGTVGWAWAIGALTLEFRLRRDGRPGVGLGGGGTGMDQGRAWIDRLPDELGGQQAIMRRLLTFSEADPDVCWLAIGCSVARGAGDRMSDLDMGIGVYEEVFEAARDRIRLAADGLGDLVESYHHQLPGVPPPHERVFAQYADGCQLDLVILPAVLPGGPLPRTVMLYDRDGQVAAAGSGTAISNGSGRAAEHGIAADEGKAEPADGGPAPGPGAGQLREWAFGGWCALADLAKYVRRGSVWEALDRLHEGRTQLWRLHAAASGIADPQYGLTSVLDFAPDDIPGGIEETVAGLSLPSLLAAARQVARLLTATGQRLPAGAQAALPHAMATYVTHLLDSIEL
jgi:hypothetical protein